MAALAALVLLLGGQMVDGHVHKAAHGGVIAHLGRQHLEVLVDQHRIEAWLLDEKERPLPPRGELRITLEIPGEAPRTLTLPAGETRYAAPVSLDLPPEMHIGAELRIGKQVRRVRFRWTVLDARHRLDDTAAPDGRKL